MRYETITKNFAITTEQKEVFHDILETMEFDEKDIHIALELAEKELSMNILLSTLASFAYYDSEDDFDEDYAESIFQSIVFIIRSVCDMESLIDEQGELLIPSAKEFA